MLTSGSDRELRFFSRKVLGALITLVFVICFNFFLFRVVESDPVASLFRGRNLTQSQRAELTKQFGLDKSTGGQFVDYLKQTATLNFGRSYQTNQPVGTRSSARRCPPSRSWASRGSSRRCSA